MDSNPIDSSLLPPNKRFKLNHNQSNLPASPPPAAFSLPAKKRVWALPPDFDLNSDPPNSKDGTSDVNVDDDDGIVCAVCQSTDGDPADPIVLCDGCDLMVHVSCYGAPLIHGVPSGDWFCAQCSRPDNTPAICCCLCPNLGGALKRVDEARWAHVVCAVLVPEVFFKDAEGREGIECSNVPERRFRGRCFVCGRAGVGCVIDCSEPKCGLGFHVTCGLREDLCIEYRQGKTKSDVVAGFCKTHSDLWKKQEGTGKFKIVAREE